MFDMMIVVGIPGVTHERFHDVRKGHIQPFPALLENTVVVDMVVHQKCERTNTSTGICKMYNGMQVGEVLEKSNCAPQIDRKV